jgi:hypothetical protein
MAATKRKMKSKVVENRLRSGYDSRRYVNVSTIERKTNFLEKTQTTSQHPEVMSIYIVPYVSTRCIHVATLEKNHFPYYCFLHGELFQLRNVLTMGDSSSFCEILKGCTREKEILTMHERRTPRQKEGPVHRSFFTPSLQAFFQLVEREVVMLGTGSSVVNVRSNSCQTRTGSVIPA